MTDPTLISIATHHAEVDHSSIGGLEFAQNC